ncbi:tetratricopeptide repeat protein [Sphingomonas sp. ST-64]|uniref:Tetratricopeptide repeat protein n=1 Tax=Sphingomonas plantiphila TaxID=3163295 RepID=A0ABW8YMG0_9SPHN
MQPFRTQIALAVALAWAGVAQAQVEVEIRNPSDAFMAEFEAGDLREALPLIEPDAKACIAAAGGDRATIDSLDTCVLLLAYYGVTLGEAGRSREGVMWARKAAEVAATFGNESEVALVANFFLGLALERMGQHGNAEAPFRQALVAAEKLLTDEADLAPYLARRANNLVMIGRFEEALPLVARAIGASGDTIDGNFYRLIHGNALVKLGRLSEAEKTLRVGVARLTAQIGATADQTIAVREALALCLDAQNRPDEALAIWRETVALRRAQGEGHALGDSLTGLGVTLIRLGIHREAEVALRDALTSRLRYFGEASSFTGLAYSNLGLALMESGQNAEATAMFSQALAVLNAAGGANPEEQVVLMNNLATVMRREGGYAEAVAVQRKALALAESSFGRGHVRTILVRNNLAVALGRLKSRPEAIALLEISYAAARALEAQGGQLRALAAMSLAVFVADEGDRAKAAEWHRVAERDARMAFRADHAQRINILWSYGRFLLDESRGLPLARTLLRDAASQVVARSARGADFDAQAQSQLGEFTVVFRDQVRSAWALAQRHN